MHKKDHNQTPFFTSLKAYAESKTIPFDVPGHKMGLIDDDFYQYLGKNVLALDSNAPRGLDNLSNPQGVIKDAQDLMADAFKADRAFFLTGGTTEGILAMIMASCRAKEKILLPRNVHKSVINALILSGAMPIFMKPEMDNDLGIANGVSLQTVKETILMHTDAKAIFIINPTYFGVTSDLEEIVKLAHAHDIAVLVDEAHGAHFGFHEQMPKSAMEAGADISAASIHKTIGSLTQSSVLLLKSQLIDANRIKSTLNILRSTSPSSLLMASLDTSRKHMYFNGNKRLDTLIQMVKETKDKINQIEGIKTFDGNYFMANGAFSYDQTKIIIKVSDLGITGFEAYQILSDTFGVQLELAETHLILAVPSIATTKEHLDKFVEALKGLAKDFRSDHKPRIKIRYTYPEAYTRPREAYHAPKTYVHVDDALGAIAAESIMIYPPGIPIIIPGEVITEDILEDLSFYKKQGSTVLSDTEDSYIKVIDIKHWEKWEGEESEI